MILRGARPTPRPSCGGALEQGSWTCLQVSCLHAHRSSACLVAQWPAVQCYALRSSLQLQMQVREPPAPQPHRFSMFALSKFACFQRVGWLDQSWFYFSQQLASNTHAGIARKQPMEAKAPS